MPRECAFCPAPANCGEHLWSDWLNKLLPGKKRFTIRNENREIVSDWVAPELNWTAKVVCEPCNNEWMSDIENVHAKPSMTDLILGKSDVPVDQSRANSIALFAFKTAVVFDHLSREREPFFERSSRHEFRNSLTIPYNVDMFLTEFVASGKGEAHTCYHDGQIPPDKSLEMYVCTYAIEHLVIQVIGYKVQGDLHKVDTKHNFEAVPFWPRIPDAFVWPPTSVLHTVNDFDSFSGRWQNVDATF
jgi:hypothetical protein